MQEIETLERRVVELERGFADLRQQLASNQKVNWIERMKGCVTDREAFREATEFGRQYRYSDRPNDECSEGS